MSRVLKRSGIVVASFPFLYNEHGTPFDFQRFTAHRARSLFPGFDPVHLHRQGGIGSTMITLLLNWIEFSMNRRFVTRLLKAPLLPVWLLLCLALNTIGWMLDKADRTDAFYGNVLLVARKP